jgi:hypothetical protein
VEEAMTQKTKIIIGTIILLIMLCAILVSIWGVYAIWNNPTVRESVESAKSEFSAMVDLREKTLATYPCQDAGVQIMNGTTLNITLINSEYSNLSYSEQAEKAEEIASFVKNNYSGSINILRIGITFTESAQTGPINTNRFNSFSFDVSELK